MTTTTFEKRTALLSKNSQAYKNAKLLLTQGGKVRTCHTSGRGRFTSNLDYTNETIKALCLLGLKLNEDFKKGNDAPKGGLTGNYVELTAKGRTKMIKS